MEKPNIEDALRVMGNLHDELLSRLETLPPDSVTEGEVEALIEARTMLGLPDPVDTWLNEAAAYHGISLPTE